MIEVISLIPESIPQVILSIVAGGVLGFVAVFVTGD